MQHYDSRFHASLLARRATARFDRVSSCLLACLAFGFALGCSPQTAGKGPVAPTHEMGVAEAQAIVEKERAQAGLPTAESAAPASVAEALTIMELDQSERFAKTRDYLAALPGVDALVVRAALELLWAEGQVTVAQLAREQAKQKDAEAAMRAETLKLQPNDTALQASFEAEKRAAARERQLRDALETLAEPHYQAGMTLALEVVRRNPERADGHAVLANLYRLKHEWVEFETHMQKAQASEAERVGVLYARALERDARLGDRPGARKELEALLVEHPRLARAQAQLVILQDDIAGRHAELQKLRVINPQHALVQLEGKAIEAEYQTSQALHGGEVTAPSAPAASPPSP
jgi:hypothetical protein